MVRSGSSRTRFILGVTVLSSLTLLAGGARFASVSGKARDSLAPVRAAGKKATSPIERQVAKLSIDKLRADNARLRRELDAAKANAARYEDAVRQRRELLALQKLADPDGLRSIAGRVIDDGVELFDDKVILDIGENDGVVVGATVVTGTGLVGRVVSASGNESSVLLISDPASRVGVRLSESGDVGIARGVAVGDPLAVDLIAPDTQVAKGEIMVTSGLQRSLYPAGIPVASVRTVKPGAIQQEVTITPLADLAHLEFVKVLIPKTPTPAPAASGTGSSGTGT